jgi:hypothetical protein
MFKTASLLISLSCCFVSAAVAQVMPWKMTTNEVRYQINYYAPAEGDQATYRAAATWNNVGSRLQFIADGLTYADENSQYATSDVPGVQISTRPRSLYEAQYPKWHALTWRTPTDTTYTTSSDADITLNADRIAAGNYYYGTGTPPTGQYDYQSLLTHELGHVAGFNHDPDSTHTNCVMRADLLPTDLKRTPCGAETTALRNKYP